MTLKLANASGLMGKISNNLLNFGTEKVSAFTFPVEGIPLTRELLDEYMGAYTFNSWYEQRKDGAWVPCTWWGKRENRDYHVDDEFLCETMSITVSGDRVLEFQSQEPESEDGDPIPAARIKRIVLTPKDGGITLLAFHMQLLPGLGPTNLALQEHQRRHVSITFGDTKAVEREEEAQGDLPLAEPPPRDTTHVWWQHGETGEQSNGLRCDIPPGCVEIDPPHGSKSEAVQEAQQAGELVQAEPPWPEAAKLEGEGDAAPFADTPPPTPEELQAFESGAAAQVAAFNAAPGEVIDGRSERVKHQDRQRGRGKRQGAH